MELPSFLSAGAALRPHEVQLPAAAPRGGATGERVYDEPLVINGD